MAVILITGGARSGKSTRAEARAGELPGGEGNDTRQMGAIAHVQMPIVGTKQGQLSHERESSGRERRKLRPGSTRARRTRSALQW